ncbi:vegetative cell wall protein gp1-like [Vitis riparia]|uniref:vegetative cell wall protein gp1-like n=1 Tax=Vitis riparia TaxID=96939 RepID=UPI00155A2BB1|nr:vegetative cell wall protein gp1-like [Vitis riparia]
MPKTRGGYTSAPPSSQRAAPVRAPLDAPSHLPDSAPQSKYHTRRASATPVAPTQIPPRSPPTKKSKTSEPGESSRAPRDSQSQPPSARSPRPSSPIEGNFDCRSRTFHVEVQLHQHSPELPEPREVPPALSTSAPPQPVPEVASSDAPPAIPPTSEPPITIPGAEYRALLAFFQTLTTTQTAIMERIDHFQLQQDQQTLILREIQQRLVLVYVFEPVWENDGGLDIRDKIVQFWKVSS